MNNKIIDVIEDSFSCFDTARKHFDNLIYKKLKKKNVINKYKNSPKYLNIGGGRFVREHWRVLDFDSEWYNYNNIFIDFNVNLESTKKWQIKDNSYDLIFSSHTFEHLTDKAVFHALNESYRILKKGGAIRINVPDVDVAFLHYYNKNILWFIDKKPEELYSYRHGQKSFIMEECLLSFFATHLTNTKARTNDEHCVDFEKVRYDINNLNKKDFLNKYSKMIKNSWQKEKPGLHRNWFNFSKLERMLKNAKFNEIIERKCCQSSKTEFCFKEFSDRPGRSIFVEARK